MKTILIAILAVLIIISGAFYWYDYRPNQIREECLRWVEENNKGEVQISTSTPGTISFQGEIVIRGAYYAGCLWGHGLEK